jgi:dipeptidyl aminopeptidase/acylaminoacyl peptidase
VSRFGTTDELHANPQLCSIDDKVPIQQSKDVVAALQAKRIPHEFEVREGDDHLFDMSKDVTLDRMYAFIKKHL